MVFSILNNTDFIVIGRESGGLSRISDFLSKYDITGRFVDESNLDEFSTADLKKIDWHNVNKKIKKARLDSLNWLLDSLS